MQSAQQLGLWSLIAVLAFLGCVAMPAKSRRFEPLQLEPIGSSQLQNVLRVSDSIVSGGEPATAAAFDELSALGVKTIVSVDGIRPDVESAKSRGLRTVHVPLGYDGIDGTAAQILERVVRECETPIYVHCHHGLHRGPAAAAMLWLALERNPPSSKDRRDARRILERAGTSSDYPGLWESVQHWDPSAEPKGPSAGPAPQLPETSRVDSLTAAMAAAGRAFDHLQRCCSEAWRSPADHDDLVAAREAVLLHEALNESLRASGSERDVDFRTSLAALAELAGRLRLAIERDDTASATALLEAVDHGCATCHQRHRDRP